jgi:hypothetical protein
MQFRPNITLIRLLIMLSVMLLLVQLLGMVLRWICPGRFIQI